ncbi:MAG: DUF1552 domain-containing protein [Myxococcota bacterium]
MRRNGGNLGRRHFLRGAGGVAMALPCLEMFSGSASARPDGEGPRRMISFFHPQGMIMDAWRPSGVGPEYTLSEILQPLSAVNPATGNSLQEDIVVVSGLNNTVVRLNMLAGGHSSASHSLFSCQPLTPNLAPDGSLLPEGQQTSNPDRTDHAAGPSIEQVVAERVGADTAYRSLDFSIGSRQEAHNAQAFYAAADDPIEPEDDPFAAFDRLFSDLDVTDPTPLQRIRAARGSVLDAVNESFTQLNARVGAEDRIRLEAHAEKIRQLENTLGAGIPLPACETPTLGNLGGYDPTDNSDFGSDYAAPVMMDLGVMALACDMSRVATFQFAHGHAPEFAWMGQSIPGGFNGWHDMIHIARDTPDGRPAMIAAMRWYTEMFVYLLQQLASIPEGDGTMLDNTLVLWLSEFGDGNGHNSQNLPAVLAGNVCGRVNTGQHLDHTDRSVGDLGTTVLNAFGFDDERFGYLGETYEGPTVTGALPGVLV